MYLILYDEHVCISVPEAPERIKGVVSSVDSVIISWLPPKRPNGVITEYTVFARIFEQGKEVKVLGTPSPPHILHFKVSKLKPNEPCEFWVTASTKVGQGQSSAIIKMSSSPIGK